MVRGAGSKVVGGGRALGAVGSRAGKRVRVAPVRYEAGPAKSEGAAERAAAKQAAVAQGAAAASKAGSGGRPTPEAFRVVACGERVAVAGAPKRNARGELVFDDFPNFRPTLSPDQVIRAGSFGGIYFNPKGGKAGIKGRLVDVGTEEYPAEWFSGLPRDSYAGRRYRKEVNKHGVVAGQDQAYWEEKGWIIPQDPRGWFQWYTRFYLGRRTADDARQVSRWAGVAGAKGRWKAALLNTCLRQGRNWDDKRSSPVIRQTLLHWGMEVTGRDWDEHLARLKAKAAK